MVVVEWWNFIAKKEQLLSISTTTICVVLFAVLIHFNKKHTFLSKSCWYHVVCLSYIHNILFCHNTHKKSTSKIATSFSFSQEISLFNKWKHPFPHFLVVFLQFAYFHKNFLSHLLDFTNSCQHCHFLVENLISQPIFVPFLIFHNKTKPMTHNHALFITNELGNAVVVFCSSVPFFVARTFLIFFIELLQSIALLSFSLWTYPMLSSFSQQLDSSSNPNNSVKYAIGTTPRNLFHASTKENSYVDKKEMKNGCLKRIQMVFAMIFL